MGKRNRLKQQQTRSRIEILENEKDNGENKQDPATLDILKKEVQKEQQARRKQFIQGIEELQKKYRCKVIGVPQWRASQDGWKLVTLVDVYVES